MRVLMDCSRIGRSSGETFFASRRAGFLVTSLMVNWYVSSDCLSANSHKANWSMKSALKQLFGGKTFLKMEVRIRGDEANPLRADQPCSALPTNEHQRDHDLQRRTSAKLKRMRMLSVDGL
jgi:hypothetical protein